MTRALFGDVSFLVSPGRVMVPRPASESLVERAVELVGDRPVRVADVGTGSGAIAVSIARLAPRAEVWATDIDVEAAVLARRNALRQGVASRVRVVEGDLLAGVPGPLDLIVANLPYLPDGEDEPGVAGEPPHAVFAPGDGLGPYRRLLDESERLLAEDGTVLVQYRRCLLEARKPGLDGLRDRLEQLAYQAERRSSAISSAPAGRGFALAPGLTATASATS